MQKRPSDLEEMANRLGSQLFISSSSLTHSNILWEWFLVKFSIDDDFLLLLSSGLSSYTTIERLESLFSPFGSVSEGTHLLLNHRFQIQFPFLTMEIFNVCSSASSWSKNPEAQRVWFCHISIPGWSKEGSSSHEWSGMCPPAYAHNLFDEMSDWRFISYLHLSHLEYGSVWICLLLRIHFNWILLNQCLQYAYLLGLINLSFRPRCWFW